MAVSGANEINVNSSYRQYEALRATPWAITIMPTSYWHL